MGGWSVNSRRFTKAEEEVRKRENKSFVDYKSISGKKKTGVFPNSENIITKISQIAHFLWEFQ